jgi:HK97 family phage portal protein
MGVLDIFRKKSIITKEPAVPYLYNYGQAIPPDRDMRGFINAFGEVGWLFAVLSKIAQGVADAEWCLYTERNGELKEVENSPIMQLLDFVNPFQTFQEFIELHEIYMGLTGECFWVINRNKGGLPGEMWIVPPDKMSVVPSKKDFIAGYVYQIGGEKIPLDKELVIHHKLPNPSNPYRGLGPVQALAYDLDSELYAGKWNRNFFYNSARPDGILSFDTLSEEQYNRLKLQWNERYRGTANAHKMALVEGAAKYQQISVSAKDMDFKELRLLNRDNILGIFGMPLSVMGITENVNRANAEAGDYTFARWIVTPRLNRLKNKLNEQFIPMWPYSENLYLDFDDVVPESVEEKRALAESGIKSGYMTINEARELQGLDPLDDGDVLVAPPAPFGGLTLSAKKKATEQELVYWGTYIKGIDQKKKDIEEVARQRWRDQYEEVLGNLNDPEGELIDRDKSKAAWLLLLIPVFISIYTSSAREADAIVNPGVTYHITPSAEQWILDHAGEMIKFIDDGTISKLREALTEGMRAGETVPELTARVQGIFTDYIGPESYRAERIARYETMQAANKAAIERYREAGVEQWKWLCGPDPCPDCEPYDGQIFTLDEMPTPPLHPNCVCAPAPVI